MPWSLKSLGEKRAIAWRQRRLGLVLLFPLALASIASFVGSFRTTQWYQDVMLNFAFLFLGAFLAVAYVDWAVRRYEEKRWSKPRAIALIRLRRTATHFVNNVSMHLSGEEFEKAMAFQPSGFMRRVDPMDYVLHLYSNPDWIEFVRQDVIPNVPAASKDRDTQSLNRMIDMLDGYSTSIKDNLSLFSDYLSPMQVDSLAAILDRIPLERWALEAQKNGPTNQLPPDLTSIVERSLDLIIESNRSPDTHLAPLWEEEC